MHDVRKASCCFVLEKYMSSATLLHSQEMTSSFYLGSGVINTLSTSTSEVTGPFLLPEMVERLAGMLNYFLLYLAGPQRKMLKVNSAIRRRLVCHWLFYAACLWIL
jgi:hypothetical protein